MLINVEILLPVCYNLMKYKQHVTLLLALQFLKLWLKILLNPGKWNFKEQFKYLVSSNGQPTIKLNALFQLQMGRYPKCVCWVV